MIQVTQEQLDFMQEAKEFFEKDEGYATYRDPRNDFIALRFGGDRNGILVFELASSGTLFSRVLDKAPPLVVAVPADVAPASKNKPPITRVLKTADGVRIHYVPHEWNDFKGDYILSAETQRTFDDIYLHCIENGLKEYNFHLWEECDS